MSTYIDLGQKLTDARYIAAALPPPNSMQRVTTLQQTASLVDTLSTLLETPTPTPEDCAELRRLEAAIQRILKFCPIINPVPEM
jgi:hypothetical protein